MVAVEACAVAGWVYDYRDSGCTLPGRQHRQRGLEVFLVDPRQVRRGGSLKTDVGCQWIRRLHAATLLSPSFLPDEKIRVFRAYLRRRLALTADVGRSINRCRRRCN